MNYDTIDLSTLDYDTVTYGTVNMSDIGEVDFSQVFEDDADTVRKSLDNKLFIIHWIVEPTFIEDGTIIPDGLYTHEEILEVVRHEPWQSDEP
mgnify:FL=1|tara:strand:- start:4400 stop:4678 length:279 start_codon:yes stop_codon:yes gene_type:complete